MTEKLFGITDTGRVAAPNNSRSLLSKWIGVMGNLEYVSTMRWDQNLKHLHGIKFDLREN